MDFKRECLRTEAPRDSLNAKDPILQAGLELVADTGRLIGLFKRKAFYKEDVDPSRIEHAGAVASSSLGSFVHNYKREHEGRLRNPEPSQVNARFMHAIIGLYGESGGLASTLLEQKRFGDHKFDPLKMIDCLGGAFWYLTIIMDELGVSESEVKEAIIRKLAVRYPDGFTEQRAVERDLQAERMALSGMPAE